MGLVCVFCGATNTLVASIVLAAELFSGAGFELMALALSLIHILRNSPGMKEEVRKSVRKQISI